MTEVRGLPAYLDNGQIVAVEDDVQNVIRDMRAISDRLHCWYDDRSSEFHIVEHCLDGEERLVFSTKELDQRVISRLRLADHWHGHETPRHVLGDNEDVLTVIDQYNEGLEAQARQQTAERVHDAGERFAWALDLCKDKSSVKGSIHVPRSV